MLLAAGVRKVGVEDDARTCDSCLPAAVLAWRRRDGKGETSKTKIGPRRWLQHWSRQNTTTWQNSPRQILLTLIWMSKILSSHFLWFGVCVHTPLALSKMRESGGQSACSGGGGSSSSSSCRASRLCQSKWKWDAVNAVQHRVNWEDGRKTGFCRTPVGGRPVSPFGYCYCCACPLCAPFTLCKSDTANHQIQEYHIENILVKPWWRHSWSRH